MSDPKLVITQETWASLSHDQKLQITYDTAISTRESVIEINKKLDMLLNKPSPCPLETRVEKLEKGKIIKNAISFLGGILGGFGGSHIPK